jgi:hypothetical protein
MTPTATDELPADLVEQVNALSPAAKNKLFELLLSEGDEISAEPMPYASEAVRLAWKDEIARRIAAYQRGELEVIPAEKVLAMLEADQAEDERHAG